MNLILPAEQTNIQAPVSFRPSDAVFTSVSGQTSEKGKLQDTIPDRSMFIFGQFNMQTGFKTAVN
jgi:hypothetical protein